MYQTNRHKIKRAAAQNLVELPQDQTQHPQAVNLPLFLEATFLPSSNALKIFGMGMMGGHQVAVFASKMDADPHSSEVISAAVRQGVMLLPKQGPRDTPEHRASLYHKVYQFPRKLLKGRGQGTFQPAPLEMKWENRRASSNQGKP